MPWEQCFTRLHKSFTRLSRTLPSSPCRTLFPSPFSPCNSLCFCSLPIHNIFFFCNLTPEATFWGQTSPEFPRQSKPPLPLSGRPGILIKCSWKTQVRWKSGEYWLWLDMGQLMEPGWNPCRLGERLWTHGRYRKSLDSNNCGVSSCRYFGNLFLKFSIS